MNDLTAAYTPEGGNVALVVLLPIAGAVALVAGKYVSTPYDKEFESAAGKYGVDSDLLRAIARRESDFNAKAVSPPNTNGTRDYGLMQINDRTARTFNVLPAELTGAAGVPKSLDVACRLLIAVRRELGDKASLYTVVAAYNAGSPAIAKRGIFNRGYVGEVLMHHQFYAVGRLLRTTGRA